MTRRSLSAFRKALHAPPKPGFGIDLRTWLSARSSIDISVHALSSLRWTSKDPDAAFHTGEGEQVTESDTPTWVPPNTWRTGLAVGYTHTLADTVTLHVALGVAQTQLYDGGIANHGARSHQSALALGIGSFQSIGLGPQPLLRIHLRDWAALNADVSVRYRFDRRVFEETYLAGASFVW